MNKEILEKEVIKLTLYPKGILAIDESASTCGKRFEKLGVENTEENRRKYREMLVTTPRIEEYLSGYIFVEETAKQKTYDGKSFVEVLKEKNISVGITGYTGYNIFSQDGNIKQEITEGIDDFEMRLKDYKNLGATFSKWREMIRIDKGIPTEDFLKENADRLAKYAYICQKEGVVPIIEPEVMMDGNHSLEDCYMVMEKNFKVVFDALKRHDVYLKGTILKTSMVIAGKEYKEKSNTYDVATNTLKCLKENVPNEIGGIVFLSGGQTEDEATEHLKKMHEIDKDLPWPLTFSYGRAIQQPALEAWAKNMEDISTAQRLLLDRARMNSEANLI